MHELVLIRHGESTWNRDNRFTGWADVDLSERGVSQAIESGRLLGQEGYQFDVAYTSVLKRAIRTLWLVLDELDQMWIPVHRSWRLNERHYGALQGLNKAETAARYGEAQVHVWRRSFDTHPPALDEASEHYPGRDPRYAALSKSEVPVAESLADTIERFMPYWHQTIAPVVRAGRRVLVCAHGNTLRALAMYLDNLTEDGILALNIPTGVPLVYELGEDLASRAHRYLGDPKAIEAAMAAVANQGKAHVP